MTFERAVKIVGSDWVEWFSALDPQLKPQVLETQIGFAILYRRVDLSEALEAIRDH